MVDEAAIRHLFKKPDDGRGNSQLLARDRDPLKGAGGGPVFRYGFAQTVQENRRQIESSDFEGRKVVEQQFWIQAAFRTGDDERPARTQRVEYFLIGDIEAHRGQLKSP